MVDSAIVSCQLIANSIQCYCIPSASLCIVLCVYLFEHSILVYFNSHKGTVVRCCEFKCAIKNCLRIRNDLALIWVLHSRWFFWLRLNIGQISSGTGRIRPGQKVPDPTGSGVATLIGKVFFQWTCNKIVHGFTRYFCCKHTSWSAIFSSTKCRILREKKFVMINLFGASKKLYCNGTGTLYAPIILKSGVQFLNK